MKGTIQELKEEEMIHPDTQTEKGSLEARPLPCCLKTSGHPPPALRSLRPEKSHQAPISTSCSFTQGYSCLLGPANEPFGPFNNP